jgi:hypothetical protein
MGGSELRKLLKLLYLLISVLVQGVALATLDCYRKYTAALAKRLD